MVKVFFANILNHIKIAIEYKVSFIINFGSQAFLFFNYYFIILALFDRFSNIKGYTLFEVLLCFGIIHCGYSTCEVIFRGIDNFENLIIDGSLDRYIVRPRSILLQALCSDIQLIKRPRVIESLIIILIAIIKLHITWSYLKVIGLLLMLMASTIIFFSIFLITASYCFITVQGLEVKNVFTDGGKYMAQYPISIYSKPFRFIFTFIIPYAFINYYPLLYFLDKTNNIFYLISPLLVLVFLIPGLLFFHIGLKHYNSVGS